jgi:pimeloyl-ACP methyl ester carboxylesterase
MHTQINSWRGKFIDIDGLRIHYVERGQGSPLLLVHGLGVYSYTWRYNIDAFASHFHVYALDLKGFGLSDKPRGKGYSIDDQVQLVKSFIDKLGLGCVDFVGSSMGGEIGLRLALYEPALINRLLLIASSAYRDRLPNHARLLARMPLFYPVRRYLEKKYLRMELLYEIVKSAYHNPAFISEEELQTILQPVFTPGFVESFLMTLKEFDFGKRQNEYGRIEAKTLILAGENDRVIPLAHCKRLAEDIKNARLHIVAQSGHFLHEEQADRVNDAVLSFLTSTQPYLI